MWNIVYYVILAVILLVSIGLHEYAHALVSHKLGDPTPKMQKRLTPNPLRHLDPIGFLMIFLIHFGRWKPVQINPAYYKKRKQGELMVALAWPATNLLLALIAILIMLIYSRILWIHGTDLQNIVDLLFQWFIAWDLVIFFWWLFAIINIALAVFNMIPLPPLDWFRLVKSFWATGAYWMQKYQMYIAIWFLVLILWPGKNIVWWAISGIAHALFNWIFGFLWHIIFY